ncbi:EAL domain-containing response regulator [Mesoterricola silvestris]|uniref:Transcriptional regulator n=1 Tax=Mesoterricola silvestris TaxID=2927979 RepID=A0AA48GNE6_9BACT|nr:EAL domain-containing response regulator [Mesoterricola silvestris]BDU72730.1 transcriptional regulator [Mesoterricola silvestris]
MTLPEGYPSLGAELHCPCVRGRKVLIIDDSRMARLQLTALVSKLGPAQVTEAADGIEALSILAEEPEIHLVLCDLQMPRMDGVALIGRIAGLGLTPQLVITSGLESGIIETVRHMALSYGFPCVGILPKPTTLPELVTLLTSQEFSEGLAATGPRPGGHEALPLQDIRAGMRNQEFDCYFQPQVSMQDNRLKGVEALVRWQHPELGLLRPGRFLPQLEESPDTMSELTLQILQNIADKRAQWQKEGLDPDVSVNLSASSLSTEGFADRIFEAVSAHSLEPEKMVLEVTESASTANLGHSLSNLARLRMRGFRLSIDDFGTGYATYEQLERIPFTELKIDMSVTRELGKSKKHAILAKSLLRLARDLRLHTVAEGIETQEGWNVLKTLGCNCGQGYFLARPMPAGQMPEWSRQERPHLDAYHPGNDRRAVPRA